jgi:hypothetical protein
MTIASKTALQTRREEELRRKKEKEEEAKAEALKEAKDKAEREKRKKERDAQRKAEQDAQKKKEEEERKKAAEEQRLKEEAAKAAAAAEAAAAKDKPDDKINDHLRNLNSGGEDKMEEDEDEEAKDDEKGLKSPPKKKPKRKNKPKLTKEEKEEEKKRKKEEKEKKKREEQERKAKEAAAAKTYADTAKTSSVLKTGRYTAGGGVADKATQKKREEMAAYAHKYVGWILELAVRLVADDKPSELVHAIRKLLENAQKTCPVAVLAPAKAGKGTNIFFTSDISFNLAELNLHVKIQNGATCFQMKKPWGKGEDPDAEPEDPVVYLSLALSSDEDPEEVIEGMAAEWSRCGGVKMFRKKLQSFKTKSPVAFFFLLNSANQSTISAEYKRILEEAQDIATWEDMDGDFDAATATVPDVSIRVAVPQLKGQDTSIYKGWSNKQNWCRKLMHVECDKEHVAVLKCLTQAATDLGLFTKYWGKKAKPAILDDVGDEAKLNLHNLISMAKKHVNYESSMIYTGIVGIMSLDKEVEIKSVTDPSVTVGTITCRQMLYSMVKLPGNPPLPLICEIHQKTPVSSIDIVIPNCPEAEAMVGQINKNFPAYMYHYLQTVAKMDEDTVMALLHASADPSLMHAMDDCTWDDKTLILTTPEDKQREEEEAMERAAWYKDAFAAQGTSKKAYANKGMLFNMDDDHSVTTIHNRPGKTYAGSPGAATINLGGVTPEHGVVGEEADSPSDGGEGLLAMTKEELIALLEQKQQRKGSQPESEASKSSSSDSDSESSSSEGSGSSNRSPPGAGEAVESVRAADEG